MSDKISVIVPLYNSEKYIGKCIESIINQSYKNIELIIIDDNSSDQSSFVVYSYLSKYNNIRYYKNKQNFGPSYCRNIGLSTIESPYVLFLDSDDWIDLNCISKALDKFESNEDIDIVIWEIKTVYKDYKISERYKYNYNNTISKNMALSLLSHSFTNEFFLSPLLGCKLFKTSILKDNKITFIDTLYEDDIFSFLSLYHSKKIGLITNSNLYYYQNSDSITHHFSEKHITDLFLSFTKLQKSLDFSSEALKKLFYRYVQKCMDSVIQRMNDCVSDLSEIAYYKTLLLDGFHSNMNISEFFRFSEYLCI